MALKYTDQWRKARGGIADVVSLVRENKKQGSYEVDTVWYLKENTLRENVLREYDGTVSLTDRRVYMHPHVEKVAINLNRFLCGFSLSQVIVFGEKKEDLSHS